MSEKNMRPAAQFRCSQLISTYGPGAMVDLPKHAVVMGGLQAWPKRERLVDLDEDRLLSRVRELTGVPDIELRKPPQNEDDDPPIAGVTAYVFPEWFIAEWTLTGAALDAIRARVRERMDPRGGWMSLIRAFTDPSPETRIRVRPLVHARALNAKLRYEPDWGGAKGAKSVPVVPVRFVQACPAGHLEDIRWRSFAHHDHRTEGQCHHPLWFVERGTSGELGDILIVCGCGAHMPLAFASMEHRGDAEHGHPLGACGGRRPWLGNTAATECIAHEGNGKPRMAKLLVRTASNAYFPQIVRAISIPDPFKELGERVTAYWDLLLKSVTDVSHLQAMSFVPDIQALVEKFGTDAVMGAIKRRRGASDAPKVPSLKAAELAVFMAATEVPDAPLSQVEAIFSAQRIPLVGARDEVSALIDRVVLVHRLREVSALVGFTRFDPALPDIEGELDIQVGRAPLAEPLRYVPAVESKGEGVFLALSTPAVQAWLASKANQRNELLAEAFNGWKEASPHDTFDWPGAAFVLLHTLSHLLIEAVALSCGYAASSIRERIYVSGPEVPPEQAVYGLLLYTASSDAEGTLGGLLEVGKRLGAVLEQALDAARLCSNDPVCAAHQPWDGAEERFLQGAACHGCVLIAETSCERMNELLDRALVVPTVTTDVAFFP